MRDDTGVGNCPCFLRKFYDGLATAGGGMEKISKPKKDMAKDIFLEKWYRKRYRLWGGIFGGIEKKQKRYRNGMAVA
ncbi:MAG: hypothetical protein NC124_15350 [Clostridium sp.]|nr:hypothetical protein [Clostridium sp.]